MARFFVERVSQPWPDVAAWSAGAGQVSEMRRPTRGTGVSKVSPSFCVVRTRAQSCSHCQNRKSAAALVAAPNRMTNDLLLSRPHLDFPLFDTGEA